MYIKNRLASIIYKADILVLAIFGVITQIQAYGWWAFRLLAVIAGVLCAGYYLAVLILGFKDKERPLSQALCPALKGTIMVSLALSGIMATAFGSELDLVDGMAVLGLILPILILLDWLLFDEKGRIKLSAPFYFLTLPIIYFSIIIISAGHISTNVVLRYPHSFLDFSDGKVGSTLVAIGINLIIVFTFGYAYTLADKLLCGEEIVREKAAEEPAEAAEKEATATAEASGEPTAITEPERILPAGAEEIALPAEAETDMDSEDGEDIKESKDNDDDEDENDWDSDSYVIGEPTLAETEVKVTEELAMGSQKSQSPENHQKMEKSQLVDVAKPQVKPSNSKSQAPSRAKRPKSKQMDIIMPKNPQNVKTAQNSNNKNKANKRARAGKNPSAPTIESRTNAPNRNGRVRRNNRRTPKFEDITRPNSKTDKNS